MSPSLGSTTVVQSQKTDVQPNQPIIIACASPPFKPSFFKKHGLNSLGIEKYFWIMPYYLNTFKNDTSISGLYRNMSYVLGQDWDILAFSFGPE